MAAATKAASRGHRALRSADRLAAPLIQPNYLASAADMEVLVRGAAIARRLAHTQAFAPFLGDEIQPGPAVRGDADGADQYKKQSALIRFIRQSRDLFLQAHLSQL